MLELREVAHVLLRLLLLHENLLRMVILLLTKARVVMMRWHVAIAVLFGGAKSCRLIIERLQ